MYINQANQGKNNGWRVLITLLLAGGVFIANAIMYFFMTKEQIVQMYDELKKLSKNEQIISSLMPFVFLLGLLFFLVRFLHKRSVLSLTTSREKVDFRRILFSFSLIIILTLVGFFVSYSLDHSTIIWNFNPLQFAILLLISLVLFPFQIGFEEFLFRGYLMQQIAIIVRNKWFPLLFTSLLFGLLHGTNPEVAKMGMGVMFFYIGTGLLLGIMTLMDDGIELALGFHLGNNLMSALLITSDFSAIQTNAVFKYSSEIDTVNILNEMIVSMLIVYPIILFIFVKKYRWSGWTEKLTGKIHT
ncbi:MAG: CPBP family intramembrane metalloprotease [Flavobacterium sp.]|nr:CPBP family intramembrane metalloprotease [Flavobacterium sp.]